MNRMGVGLVVAIVLLSGCYRRRNIIVPSTEHGQFCANDAQLAWRVCYLEQRGWVYCDERRDRQLLACDGAYELVDGAAVPDGGAASETSTYELPGTYR